MSKRDLQKKLEEEYQRFIEFGQLLDRQTRKYLVQYLQNLLGHADFSVPDELQDQYFQYFREGLDRLFATEDLIPILQKNDNITEQLVLDTLYWIRKTYNKVRQDNPYDDEVKRLTMWSITPKHVFVTRWSVMTEYLKSVYPKEQLDIGFYQDSFQEIIGSKPLTEIPPKEQERMELILTDLLAQWDALLNAKILEHQLKKLEEEREQYLELMEAKVEEYQKLMDIITPFSDYLGWDMSRELWQDSSFDIIQKYDELLQDEESIKELADLLGRLREAEIELEEETFEKTIIRQEWVSDEFSKAEIVGVHESDDLSNLLSSEAGLLSDEGTEDLFLQKFAEKNLMTFRYEDRKLIQSEDKFTEVNQRVKQKEKGPFIVCVDTSESMTGRPEQIAKVLCLAILKMAIRENRRAYLINFSIGIKTLDLYDIANSVDELAKFLKMSFYGGTDISLPLSEALRQLKTNDYEDADVLVISDFIMYRVNKDVLKEVRHCQQNKGAQFHSLTLSDDPSSMILEYFDNNWLYDPKKKGIIRDLNREILETL
ncbi:MAG TPA: VWA domain-containing protein [Saprospiraceae bacterium]|nr:VWA domain-containing protein [Saprospiraceae bacterium]